MAVYAIGDLQGCALPLQALLDKIQFEPARDRLWFTGDVVNRGPHSLETLRLLRRFGRSAVTVLGNHDLHLLAVAGGIKRARPSDTLQPILRAPDREELLDWLRHQPLAYCDSGAESGVKTLLVHAGIYPGWRKKQVVGLAGEVETLLRGGDDEYRQFLKHMYGRNQSRWKPSMGKWQRARFITNAFTRIRFCTASGRLDFTHKGAPGSQPRALQPWFEHPAMKCKKWRLVFGHWSALGFFRRGNLIALDSGCAWGGKLTAIRLDGAHAGKVWQLQCSK